MSEATFTTEEITAPLTEEEVLDGLTEGPVDRAKASFAGAWHFTKTQSRRVKRGAIRAGKAINPYWQAFCYGYWTTWTIMMSAIFVFLLATSGAFFTAALLAAVTLNAIVTQLLSYRQIVGYNRMVAAL